MVSVKKIAIIASINGAQVQRDGINLPLSPQEIADAAYACYQAGAAAVHFHARDPDGHPTGDPKIYAEIVSRIRAKSDMLIQSTSAVGLVKDAKTGQMMFPDPSERKGLYSTGIGQDLFCIGTGSFDFYHPEGGYAQATTPQINTLKYTSDGIRAILAMGAPLEFEVVEANHLEKLSRLSDEGLFDKRRDRIWINFCFGYGAQPATPKALLDAVDQKHRHFPGVPWQVSATGKNMISLNVHAMLMGSDIARIGFEDGIYLGTGQPAKNNCDLVANIVRIAAEIGREPMTVAEARHMFRLNERKVRD